MIHFQDIDISALGLLIPEVLLPVSDTPLLSWAVIACDQYTSDPEYWRDVEKLIDKAPSSGHLILPEVYLERDDETKLSARITKIRQTMHKYLDDNIFMSMPPGVILTDRRTPHHATRKGLLLCVDLEAYDYSPNSRTPIRASEGVVPSRIPPRLRIREGAPIELTHVMLLFDDPSDTVIGPAFSEFIKNPGTRIYDTDLIKDGGHITGYFAPEDSEIVRKIFTAFDRLIRGSHDRLLFAVGDGNHSLATAKAHWDKISKTLPEEQRACHPARFALAEAVNLHDPGLTFEPIYRIAYDLPVSLLLSQAENYFSGMDFRWTEKRDLGKLSPQAQVIPILSGTSSEKDKFIGNMIISLPDAPLCAGTLQGFLDHITSEIPAVSIDYIHGIDSLLSLLTDKHTGFLLPAMEKKDFFPTLSQSGIFPRKTFSLGEAQEKRYYMEAKKIL